MHLWAAKHEGIEIGPSLLDQHQMSQGQEVEDLAQIFAQEFIQSEADVELEFQPTFHDGEFQARVDILARSPDDQNVDIYEVKSETSIKKRDKYDVTFQRLVCEATETVGSVYIIHLNKEYTRDGLIDLENLFVIENMDSVIDQLRSEVLETREDARIITAAEIPDGIETCLKPDKCPCPSLCHGDLPEHPIFDIPRLHRSKARRLLDNGVRSIHEIPADFPLSDKQRCHVDVIQAGVPQINKSMITHEFENLEYPLCYLDYETYAPAVPYYDSYGPHKPIVFQYSLHIQNGLEAELDHIEFLLTENEDPGSSLLAHLADHLPDLGSVVVWNKTFEVTRNKEMAVRYPGFQSFIDGINARVFDLMEIFSKGFYLHPNFRGSASIKKVLPIMVPDLDQGYSGLQISDGEEAMLIWFKIINGEIPLDELEQTKTDLLEYCKLDTLAMAEIFQALNRELI